MIKINKFFKINTILLFTTIILTSCMNFGEIKEIQINKSFSGTKDIGDNVLIAKYKDLFPNMFIVDDYDFNYSEIEGQLGTGMLISEGDNIYAELPDDDINYFNEKIFSIFKKQTKATGVSSTYIIKPIGTSELLEVNRDNEAKLIVTQNSREIVIGDYIYPVEDFDFSDDDKYSHTLFEKITGEIVDLPNEDMISGSKESVIINLGTSNGISKYTLLYLSNSNNKGSFSRNIGYALVYSVSKYASLALIIESKQEATIGTVVSTTK